MDFTAISIYTTEEGIEPVTGRLYTLGINGVEIVDNEDESIVKAYVAENESGSEMIKSIRESIEQLKGLDSEHAFGSLKIELSKTSEKDWADNWKRYYKPVRIGKHIVIVPEWEDYTAAEGDVIVKIDPGSAFGSGTHETTRLCLEFVEEFVSEKTRVLDIGTGSGILAVSALKLGAASALGIDIDELATDVALENAKLNGVDDKFKARCGNLADDVEGSYDLITANIVADAIIQLSPDVPAHLADGGVFIASGIIDSREGEVCAALSSCGLDVYKTKRLKNWVALACKKQ